MASAWGSSWGSAWGNSWGSTAVVVETGRGGDGFSRRQFLRDRYIANRHHVIPARPEPETPKPGEIAAKVTRKVVREALDGIPDWWGTAREAERFVPPVIALPDVGPRAETEALIRAVRAYIEAEIARQLDEDDIETLLLAA